MLVHFFDDTCLIFFRFFNISSFGSHPVKARIVKGLYMNCFDTILAYTNMLTIFYEILKLKFSKKNK